LLTANQAAAEHLASRKRIEDAGSVIESGWHASGASWLTVSRFLIHGIDRPSAGRHPKRHRNHCSLIL